MLQLELQDKTKVKAIAYDDRADFCLRELAKDDNVIIYGRINREFVEIYNTEKF